MKLWIPFETLARPAAGRNPLAWRGPASMLAVAVTMLALGAPASVLAIGPRADSQPKAPAAPPAPPAPPVPPAPAAMVPEIPEIPEIPDLPESEYYRQLLSSAGRGSPQGWFGIGLQCNRCRIARDDSTDTRVWSFTEPPRIRYVDPDGPADKAGLRHGDKLMQIDGVPITSPEGGRRFGAVKPGESQRWTYERDGKTFITTLVAGEHPDSSLLLDPSVSAELQQNLAKLRAELDGIHAERSKTLADRQTMRSYEHALRMAEEARRSLERTQESLQRRGYLVAPTPEPPEAPEPPEPPEPQRLRYEGTVGDSEVEVHGTGSIVVRKDEHGGEELVITTPDATIHIRPKK